MMLWSRLRQSRFKVNAFSNDLRRFYSLNPAPVLANQHISSRKSFPILNYPKVIVEDEQLVLFRKVRFYAKLKVPKKVERDESEPRLNEEITAPMVRLVIDEGNHCIVPRREALARAESLNLDLVEVDKKANPPVCKMFDYNKQKYVQQTKVKERTKSKEKSTLRIGSAKEVRFAAKITQNDLKVKADMCRRLMEKGYRVKCTATDTTETADLKGVLSKFTALIEDVAVDEGGAKYEKKQAFIIVRHIKFGPPNKGGKKASKAAAADSPQTKEDSEEAAPIKTSEWDTFDGDDGDAHPIFENDDKEIGQVESSKQNIPFSVDRNLGRAAEPTRIPVGMNGPGATKTTNTMPTYPNHGNQTRNTRPETRPGQQFEAPARGIPKQDSPVSRQVQAPARGVPKQDSPASRQVEAPAKSYGIFSAPKANTTAAGNRNPGDKATSESAPAKSYGIFSAPKVNTAAASNRSSGTAAASSPTAADSKISQAKYGMFSAEEKGKQTQKR